MAIPNYYIDIANTGTYRIVIDGIILNNGQAWNYQVLIRDSNNELIYNETFIFSSNNVINVVAPAGSRLYILVGGIIPPTVTYSLLTTTIDYIEGYVLGFDEAFIDFKCTDFIKEILVRFCLTPFKVKNENKIIFKTLKERLADADVIDWSDKFNSLNKQSFVFQNYAKQNNLKYKYNGENEKHNDGFLKIINENLNEEYTIFQSKTYTSEFQLQSEITIFNQEVYKIWDKELKDDGTLNYKGLRLLSIIQYPLSPHPSRKKELQARKFVYLF
jgi:hypothetical protein